MSDTMLSRSNGLSRREIRFEAEDEEDLLILDGSCAATGECIKSVMSKLLHEWAVKKKHEATLVLRFAKGTPDAMEKNRKHAE